MYKSLLLMCALVAPVFAQDAPAPDAAEKKAPAPAERRARGERPQRPGMGMMRDCGVLVEKLVIEKYDANKDGKLDDAEKAKIKEAAQKIREERTKVREERAKAREERAKDNKAEARRGEGRRGPRGEGRPGREGRPGAEGRPGVEGRPAVDMETMMVGMSLLMEKYDTDKDGRWSEDERKALQKDIDAAKPKSEEKSEEKKAE